MRKHLTILLFGLMLLLLIAGCGQKEGETEEAVPETEQIMEEAPTDSTMIDSAATAVEEKVDEAIDAAADKVKEEVGN